MDPSLCWTAGVLGSVVALSSDVKERRSVTEQPRETELFYTNGHTALGTVCMQQLQGGVRVGRDTQPSHRQAGSAGLRRREVPRPSASQAHSP